MTCLFAEVTGPYLLKFSFLQNTSKMKKSSLLLIIMMSQKEIILIQYNIWIHFHSKFTQVHFVKQTVIMNIIERPNTAVSD